MITFDAYKKEYKSFLKFIRDHNDVLGYYVYALADTRNNKRQVFYIGKGSKGRMFAHIRDAFNNKIVDKDDNDSRKIQRIQDIHKSGNKVELSIVHYGLTEEHAFLLESALIDIFSNYKEIDPQAIAEMTNVAEGFDHRKGFTSVELLSQSLVREEIKVCKGEKLLIIKIKGTDKDINSIYERVRKSWILNPNKANEAQYILACRNGLIVGVFEKVGDWKKVADENRYYFEGTVVNDPDILNRFFNKCFKTPKGASNPIQYVGDWK